MPSVSVPLSPTNKVSDFRQFWIVVTPGGCACVEVMGGLIVGISPRIRIGGSFRLYQLELIRIYGRSANFILCQT